MENYIDFIDKVWKKFIFIGKVNFKVRSEIKDLWIRCMNYGVDLYNGKGNVKYLNVKELINKNNEFILVVRFIMESIYSMVCGLGFVLFLVDKDGYIIEVIGDKDIMERVIELNFLKGELWLENVVGINVIGIVLYLNKLV